MFNISVGYIEKGAHCTHLKTSIYKNPLSSPIIFPLCILSQSQQTIYTCLLHQRFITHKVLLQGLMIN